MTLDGPAPAGGAVVRLYAAKGGATVPETVTVPAGATSAEFSIGTLPSVYGAGQARVLAEYGASRIVTFTIFQHSISGTVKRRGSPLAGAVVRAVKPPAGPATGSAAPGTSIPDDDTTGIESTINLPAAGRVASLTVAVNITHPYIGDLEVTLIHPDGTEVLLHNQTGDDADDLIVTYPATPPAGDLTTLNGKPIVGDWKLRVRDLEASDAGTLDSWSLSVEDEAVDVTATTDTDGTYTIYGLPAGSYTVTPRYSRQRFAPAARAVTVGPDAAGVDFDILAYDAVDFAQAADGTTRLLMQSVAGIRIQKWDGTAMESGPTYKPASGWTPVALASEDCGCGTFVLWKNGATSFQVWSMDATGRLSAARPVQPATGWTARDICSPGDTTARVLLEDAAGQVRVASVSGPTVTLGPALAPPAAGWSAVAIVSGADGKTRLLWKSGNAGYRVQTLDAAGALEIAGSALPTGGWTAKDLSLSGDGSVRVLLESPSGQVRIVRLPGGAAQVGPIYRPAAGWLPIGVSADPGAGTQTRLLWKNAGGVLNLWTLESAGTLQDSVLLGTY